MASNNFDRLVNSTVSENAKLFFYPKWIKDMNEKNIKRNDFGP